MGSVRCDTRVSVRDLPILADIGIDPDEIGRLQPLIVSVTLHVDEVAHDRIDATIDYRLIARKAEALGKTRIALVETFAHRLAAYCIEFDGVRGVAVDIDKPQALPTGTASISVTLVRDRVRRSRAGSSVRAGSYPSLAMVR